MALFQFSDKAAMFDSTPIENIFLVEYMPYAPDGYVRAYLYARMLALHPEMGEGLSEIAHSLRMDEESVDNAFLYWEEQGLMQKMSSNPPRYHILPMRSADIQEAQDNDHYYKYRDYISSLQAIFGEGNIMHSPDYRMAYEWVEARKMEQDAVLYLVQYEATHSKAKLVSTIFSRVNKKILEFADRHIYTLDAVQRSMMVFADEVQALAETVIKRLALRRPPTQDELNLAQKWVSEWNLGLQDVAEACEQTVHSRQPNFAYLDTILANRQKERGGAFAAMKAALKELGAPSTPTPEQMKQYEKWHGMGFEDGTIILAAKELNKRKKTTFGDLEWQLEEWAKCNLFALCAAKESVSRDDELRRITRQCLEYIGIDKRPSKGEAATVGEWRAKYSDALIFCAAECSKGTEKPFLYMRKLLEGWASAGIQTVEAAKAQHQAFHANKPSDSANTPAKNPALNYEQHEYTADDFDDDFFFNPETQKYGGKNL